MMGALLRTAVLAMLFLLSLQLLLELDLPDRIVCMPEIALLAVYPVVVTDFS
jgi:hypothetical protein